MVSGEGAPADGALGGHIKRPLTDVASFILNARSFSMATRRDRRGGYLFPCPPRAVGSITPLRNGGQRSVFVAAGQRRLKNLPQMRPGIYRPSPKYCPANQ